MVNVTEATQERIVATGRTVTPEQANTLRRIALGVILTGFTGRAFLALTVTLNAFATVAAITGNMRTAGYLVMFAASALSLTIAARLSNRRRVDRLIAYLADLNPSG